MKKTVSVQKMTAAALLIAVGIIIPAFSPLKILLEPASFTLASHVPIFLSMFISPLTAVAVSVGTTLGFFLGGFPLVVVLRAASQLIFAVVGAILLQKVPGIVGSFAKMLLFSFGIGLLHAVGEIAVVFPFYFGGNMAPGYYGQSFWVTVMGLVGLGTLVHSMLDFAIAQGILKAISRQKALGKLFQHNPYAFKTTPTAPAAK
ncbi:hypothetical protein LJC61_08155 [Ruminococcaceae bacterium OttesenSCG-928-A16]|nr:hypothetical protein [Ruminococcaceae bacterium OttesenSCG-928-A16]